MRKDKLNKTFFHCIYKGMKLLEVLDKKIVEMVMEGFQFDQRLRESIEKKLYEIYNGLGKYSVPPNTQWGTVQSVYPNLAQFCQTKEGVIGPPQYAHPGETQYNWSIVNRFDTNIKVHDEIKKIYQQDNPNKNIDVYTWFEDNAEDFLVYGGKYTDRLVDINASIFLKGATRESEAEELLKRHNSNFQISRFCSGSKSDFSNGIDLVLTLPNKKSYGVQVKPFDPTKSFRYVDDENRDYYKIYAEYYKSQNYLPKYVQLIMFVYDNEFVIFINDPNKISQKGAYTKFYENPILTNLTFATVKKETTSKHLKGVRTIFNTPPTTQ